MPKAASVIFRDYVTEAVPSSGAHKPVKSEIRALLQAVSVRYETKAAVEAANIAGDDTGFVLLAGYYAADDGGGAIYKRVAAEPAHPGKIESNDGEWLELVPEQVISDRMFGVKADAVLDVNTALVSGTDDTTALENFAAYIRHRGGGRYVLDGGIRKVWPSAISNGDVLISLDGVVGARIEYLNGASIHAMHPNSTTESSIFGVIWDITNADFVEIINPSATQEGHTDDDSATAGIIQVSWGLTQIGTITPFTCMNVRGLKQTGGIGGVIVYPAGSTSESAICRGLVADVDCYHVYYPLNLQANGDFTKGRIKLRAGGRALFFYNVCHCDFDVDLTDITPFAGVVNVTANDNPIYRPITANNRINIRARGGYTSGGYSSAVALVEKNFIHETGGSGARMQDIHINFDVILTSNASPSRLLAIHKFDNTSGIAADATGRGHVMSGCRYTGSVEGTFSGANPFALFTDNPLGTENFSGDQISNCGFYNFRAPDADMDVTLDGQGINGGVGAFVFQDSYFGGSSHTLTNWLGKVLTRNCNIRLTGTYTPTWEGSVSNPSIGNGTLSAEYEVEGDLIEVRIYLLYGSTSGAGSGTWSWSLPVPPLSATRNRYGGSAVFDTGTAYLTGVSTILGTQSVLRAVANNSGALVGSAVPVTWATSDRFECSLRYKWR